MSDAQFVLPGFSVVTAPVDCAALNSLFLAGGITGTGNWQTEMIGLLAAAGPWKNFFTILNPRRDDFDITNKAVEEEQITWEFRHLRSCAAVLFWFTPETLCPITLYELGKMVESKGKLFVGVHPDYKRKRDVEIQLRLSRPEIVIATSLEQLAKQVISGIGLVH